MSTLEFTMTQQINLYERLGLTKEASAEDIKKQFRKLVRTCHPDIAGDSPENVQRFAEIRDAYEVLSDPEKRALYDNPPTIKKVKRQIHRKTWRPPKNQSFGSIPSGKSRVKNWQRPENKVSLDEMFSSPSPKPQRSRRPSQRVYNHEKSKKGEDIHIEVEVDTRTLQKGGSVMVEYRRRVRGDHLELHPLDEIHMLRVPPGTQVGEELRVEKYGHAGGQGGPYGDLICSVLAHESSTPQSSSSTSARVNEGIITLPISVPEALLGGRVTVHTPQGKVVVSIPPCSSSGKKFRLRGKGAGGSDLTVVLQITVPASIDLESQQLIRQFATLNPISPRD